MLFLQALLCFLFGTAVVEARFWPKPPLRVRPITSRRPIIPPASYGYWVRWAIDNPQHVSKSSNRICVYLLTCRTANIR